MDFWLIWFVLAIVVGVIASSRGRSGFGWFCLAMLLSPLIGGILALALPSRIGRATPATHVKCPDCAELVLKEAKVCKHCGCRLIPQSQQATHEPAALEPLSAKVQDSLKT